ncbi:heme-binding protein 2 [Haplochromis burtoni]|uniref:Heme-binding protein 2-like n=1 Tax=Haplochromis burtoni TaxID=8153 RepID=A0A3Q2WMZ5_HAPBU|nr:heme-binding protein 2 [Haplochromis burtoni]XP_042072167.1 heme-binding protein 2 [Haplochromis burtoni]
MAQVVFALLAVFLVSLCTGQDFCPKEKCPQYKVVETHQDFEVRLYGATDWITTKLDSTRISDYLAANSRLKTYVKRQAEAGFEIPDDCWPVLVTVTEGEGDPKMSVSWFVSSGGKKGEIYDPLVKLETKPEATIYVRVFGGAPSTETGQENTKILREALAKTGKTFDPSTHAAATYESYFSFTHHNEIWISAASQQQN